MVGRWGMSPAIGPIAVIPSEAQGPLLPGASGVSEATQQLIDSEVRRIVDEAHDAVTGLLTANRDKLDSLTERLLNRETVDQGEAYEAAGVALPERAGEQPPAVAALDPSRT
jgi:cell division protease FtsH